MTPLILSGSAHPALVEEIARELQAELGSCLLERFPDGEQDVAVQAGVRGRPVFIVQPLGPPVGELLLELLLLAHACRRAGAGSVSAIVPYVGYARQDRVTKEGQPLGARVLAEALGTGGFSQVIAVDLHSPVVASCIHAPVAHLTAVPALVEALRAHVREDSVVVSPDLGAVKLAEAYARLLGLPLAVVSKIRSSGAEVAVRSVVGDVRDKRPLRCWVSARTPVLAKKSVCASKRSTDRCTRLRADLSSRRNPLESMVGSTHLRGLDHLAELRPLHAPRLRASPARAFCADDVFGKHSHPGHLRGEDTARDRVTRGRCTTGAAPPRRRRAGQRAGPPSTQPMYGRVRFRSTRSSP